MTKCTDIDPRPPCDPADAEPTPADWEAFADWVQEQGALDADLTELPDLDPEPSDLTAADVAAFLARHQLDAVPF